jgi:hypothetical protein
MVTHVRKSPRAQLYDLPIIGDDLAKVGRVIDLYAAPCQPNAEIWVYGFFQALPTLFITLTKPELVDIDIKKGGHRPRKGRKARFRASAIFRDAIIQIPVPRWVVFRVYEWTQRVGWYFLVADALEDFALNWVSMAYMYNGCEVPQLAYCNRLNSHLLQGSSTTPQFRRFVWNTAAVSNVGQNSTVTRLILDGDYLVNWTCEFQPWAIPSQSQLPLTTMLVVDGQPAEVGELGHRPDGTAYASGSAIVTRFGPPDPVLQVGGVWADANKVCWQDGTWTVSRTRDTALGPDP